MRILLLILTLSGTAALTAGEADDLFEVEIHDLLKPGSATAPRNMSRGNFRLHLVRRAGQWDFGFAAGHNQGRHRLDVISCRQEGKRLELETVFRIADDIWIAGTTADLDLAWEEAADGSLAGTYRAVVMGVSCQGSLAGRRRAIPPLAADRPAPDEHPRVLLRQRDLPALKARLATPFGQAWRRQAEASPDRINLGLLYQLTGEQRYADQARALVGEDVEDLMKLDPPLGTFGTGTFGWDCIALSLAYDLCYHGWDADYRQRLARTMQKRLPTRTYYVFGGHGGQCNWNPVSNYYGPSMGSIGIATLAFCDAKVDRPAAPAEPFSAPQPIVPDPDLVVSGTFPAEAWRSGMPPQRWLRLDPHLGFIPSDEVLESFPNAIKRQGVTPGATWTTVVKDSELRMVHRSLTFRPIDGRQEDRALTDFVAAEPFRMGKHHRTLPGLCLAAVALLEFREKVRLGFSASGVNGLSAWLIGKLSYRLDEDLAYEIWPGIYPMVVIVTTTGAPEGRLAPILAPAGHPALAGQVRRLERRQRVWQEECRRWQAEGGLDPALHWQRELAWYNNYRHIRDGIRDGGYGAETGHYSFIASMQPTVYASLCPRVLGRPASTYPDVNQILVRYLMQNSLDPQGRTQSMMISCDSSMGLGAFLPFAFTLTEPRWQPAALWAWNRLQGISGPQDAGRMFAKAGGGNNPGLGMALSFLRYPLEMTPAHPEGVLPRTWQSGPFTPLLEGIVDSVRYGPAGGEGRDPGFGFLLLRDGWKDGRECLVQAFGNGPTWGGHRSFTQGSFSLQGLGHCWTAGTPKKHTPERENANVLDLPEGTAKPKESGRIAHVWTRPDGSGGQVMDLFRLYEAPRITDAAQPDSNACWRTVAADHSGASGAACVLAIADRVAGKGPRHWYWHLPSSQTPKVQLTERGAVLTAPGATVAITVLQPAGAAFRQDGTTLVLEHADARDFLVVATLQAGPAPAVTMDGATVRIGPQTLTRQGTILGFNLPEVRP